MAVYRTCTGCLFADGPCAERDKMRAKIAGMGITSLKWKCGWRRPKFSAGEPVHISMITYGDEYDGGSWCELVDGYFVSECTTSNKVLVFAIPESVASTFDGEVALRNNGYMRLSRSYVQRRQGVPASKCSSCGNLSSATGHSEWCKHHPDAAQFAKAMGAW